VKEKRICAICKKPMGNSWHTRTEEGQLEVFVHKHCEEEVKNGIR